MDCLSGPAFPKHYGRAHGIVMTSLVKMVLWHSGWAFQAKTGTIVIKAIHDLIVASRERKLNLETLLCE